MILIIRVAVRGFHVEICQRHFQPLAFEFRINERKNFLFFSFFFHERIITWIDIIHCLWWSHGKKWFVRWRCLHMQRNAWIKWFYSYHTSRFPFNLFLLLASSAETITHTVTFDHIYFRFTHQFNVVIVILNQKNFSHRTIYRPGHCSIRS